MRFSGAIVLRVIKEQFTEATLQENGTELKKVLLNFNQGGTVSCLEV